jgi:hypothetical protein
MPTLPELLARREEACRLLPERALRTLDEADDFLRDRGLLTLMPDSSLPSLFGACHEGPYRPGGRGFASWPKTKWSWGAALAARPGVLSLRIHRGKGLFVSTETAAIVAPLCLEELARAGRGEFGEEARRLVEHLEAAGPGTVDELKEELGLDAKALRSVRDRLERVGAIVGRGLRIKTPNGGHRHTTELVRWDQLEPVVHATDGDLATLLVAAVAAAVVAPEKEARRWFSWDVSAELVEELLAAGRLVRLEGDWLATAE